MQDKWTLNWPPERTVKCSIELENENYMEIEVFNGGKQENSRG